MVWINKGSHHFYMEITVSEQNIKGIRAAENVALVFAFFKTLQHFRIAICIQDRGGDMAVDDRQYGSEGGIIQI